MVIEGLLVPGLARVWCSRIGGQSVKLIGFSRDDGFALGAGLCQQDATFHLVHYLCLLGLHGLQVALLKLAI